MLHPADDLARGERLTLRAVTAAAATGMSERTARVDELLRQEISAIIAREVQDPAVGFVTVTRVEVNPDLGHARVWVSMIGQPDERRRTFDALVRAMPFVRRELGVLRLRRIPVLHLRMDDSVERGTRVLRLLEDLEAGREPVGAEGGETLPTPGPHEAPEEPAPPVGSGASSGTPQSARTARESGRPIRAPGRSGHGTRPGERRSGARPIGPRPGDRGSRGRRDARGSGRG